MTQASGNNEISFKLRRFLQKNKWWSIFFLLLVYKTQGNLKATHFSFFFFNGKQQFLAYFCSSAKRVLNSQWVWVVGCNVPRAESWTGCKPILMSLCSYPNQAKDPKPLQLSPVPLVTSGGSSVSQEHHGDSSRPKHFKSSMRWHKCSALKISHLSTKCIFLVVESNMKVLCQFLSSRCVPNVVIDSST